MAALLGVVIEASDVSALRAFWGAALGWQPSADGSELHSPYPGRPMLRFAAAGGPKRGKNRLHLDLAGGADEVARVRALGAEPVDIGQGAVPWAVLADPEGNEFCVLPHASADDGLAALALDAADPAAQLPFWQPRTGWEVVDRGAWGVRLRHPSGTGPTLVIGPPAAPKSAPNRLRLAVSAAGSPPGCPAGSPAGSPEAELVDPEGNEFEVW
ncbi:VOC family protein [Streptacidiphilus sp. MAP5-3]|uniref:VOC family protein n=1 Tax=unclassified Streptacidiphilus TaxID=2643834 RepID=UPI00351806AA